ncbi:hypothetical protein CGCF415_v005940 [Colletotrichum fructicola]|nr:hypothetical protein CGCFRS4_v004633 [Colletotrichum fructicola]KAF4909360.1 hypothetical protein CGCF415_v005940 [Colletotrichum fructicola]KAF4935924.1 hypothetical protein CGCF245_v007136 [Colletotrichum fructicola]
MRADGPDSPVLLALLIPLTLDQIHIAESTADRYDTGLEAARTHGKEDGEIHQNLIDNLWLPPPSSPRGLDIAAAIILPKPLIRVSLGLCYRANHPRSRTECPGQRRPGHEQMVYTSLAHRRGLATIFPQVHANKMTIKDQNTNNISDQCSTSSKPS